MNDLTRHPSAGGFSSFLGRVNYDAGESSFSIVFHDTSRVDAQAAVDVLQTEINEREQTGRRERLTLMKQFMSLGTTRTFGILFIVANSCSSRKSVGTLGGNSG